MNKTFLYVDTVLKKIENNQFYCIYLLEFNSKKIFTIYKLQNENSKNLGERLASLKPFENVTPKLDYVIKRDGKISLDIKF